MSMGTFVNPCKIFFSLLSAIFEQVLFSINIITGSEMVCTRCKLLKQTPLFVKLHVIHIKVL